MQLILRGTRHRHRSTNQARKCFGRNAGRHLDRDAVTRDGDGLRRQTMEILSVAPSLTDDFTTEPIFHREALGKPLVWTGQLPSEEIVNRVEASMGHRFSLRAICDGTVSPL